jgi:hypothetical protein
MYHLSDTYNLKPNEFDVNSARAQTALSSVITSRITAEQLLINQTGVKDSERN